MVGWGRHMVARLPGVGLVPIGLWVAIGGLILCAILWLAGASVTSALVLAASAGIAFGWCITWAVARRGVAGPLAEIADSMEILAAREYWLWSTNSPVWPREMKRTNWSFTPRRCHCLAIAASGG